MSSRFRLKRPQRMPTIRASSVATITSRNRFAIRARSTTCCTSGLPVALATILPGKRVEEKRAGITAIAAKADPSTTNPGQLITAEREYDEVWGHVKKTSVTNPVSGDAQHRGFDPPEPPRIPDTGPASRKIVSATSACVWRNAFPPEEPMRPANHYPPNRKNGGNQRYPN